MGRHWATRRSGTPETPAVPDVDFPFDIDPAITFPDDVINVDWSFTNAVNNVTVQLYDWADLVNPLETVGPLNYGIGPDAVAFATVPVPATSYIAKFTAPGYIEENSPPAAYNP